MVPNRLDFYRTKIEQEPQSSSEDAPSNRAGGLAEAFMAAKGQSQLTHPNAIYGSVSLSDVLNSIRATLSNNDEASRVVLSEEDLSFEGGVAEGARNVVKRLGEFTVSIQVKGATQPVIRNVRILEQKQQS